MTPGPWFVERHGIMDATRSRTICIFGESDQDDADARLVARAPDLLAALQACWDQFNEIMVDSLYEQVKDALDLRVFTATLDEGPT